MDYTIDVEKTLVRIDSDEQTALVLGDLETAIKLNWLRNAVRFDGLSGDEAEYKRQCIVLKNAYVIDQNYPLITLG